MRQVSVKVKDKRVLRLIGDYLRAPVHLEGRVEKRTRGTTQGGPLTPPTIEQNCRWSFHPVSSASS